MPINKNLNIAPYFDDYDVEKQFYRVMFKPGYAIQARELTQLQTILQGQVEAFGDNIFKEGSIVKGCNFTELDDLQFVKVNDGPSGFNAEAYISGPAVESIQGQDVELDYVYEIVGQTTGLRAEIVQASIGFQTRPPDLNTFYINYLNTTSLATQFQAGENLVINRHKYLRGTTTGTLTSEAVITSGLAVSAGISTPHVGKSFGIESAPGIIFQKGNFIFVSEQRIVVEKYNNLPDGKSVGYQVDESLVNALQDASLYDNANGSRNENAPGADRLKLVPRLVVIDTATKTSDFFTLVRYQNGNAITVRDVSQYNVLGEELARRTYEESGNYVLEQFPLSTDDRIPAGEANTQVQVVIGPGTAYVKGYRVENSADRAFTVDQITGTEEITNQNVSMEYGNYFEVTGGDGGSGWNGRLDIDISDPPATAQTSAAATVGSVTIHNITPTRVYAHSSAYTGAVAITDMDRINDGNGYVQLQPTASGAPLIKETNKKALVFDTGVNGLFGTNNTLVPVRAQVAATHTNGTITLTANPGEDFNCLNDDMLVVDSTSVQQPITSYSTSLNNSQLDIQISSGSATNVTVYYNKRLVGSSDGIDPYNKVVRSPYIKFNYAGGTTKYSLGFPDVFDIISIVDSTGEDYSNSFRLKPNQKDTYYDISYLEYIEGRPEPTGQMTVQLKVFEVNTSTGEYFFTINSYPNSLEGWEIPSYVSSSGTVYNLRDCFDFRAHNAKDSNADYNNTSAGSAPVITATVGTYGIDFSTYGAPLIPAAQQSLQTDLEYYLTRIDTLACDSYGNISLIKGEEDRNAVPPRLGTDKLAIAHVEIPTYPALSKKQAEVLRKSDYAIRPRATGVKAYTMKDMHNLEKKIDNMAYYISLNQLESETSNLVIRDEQGLNRFKNGFIVDPFNDLTLSEITHPQFNAAVPFNQKILTPSLKTFALDLVYDSSTGSSIFPNSDEGQAATVGRNSNVSIISQPYASNFRNCVSNFYKYVGDGIISPPYDAAYDTTVNPASIDIDLTTPFQEFVDSIQSFLPMTDTSVRTVFERDPGRQGRRGAGTQTQTITTRTSEIVIDNSTTTEQFVGEFVSDFRFQPFMAARDIKVYMSGLRPNQRHYFFFDGIDVNAHVMPGSVTADSVGDVQRFGEKGAAVSTDANGVLRAVFALPPETFYVGDRVLEIVDVNQYESIDSGSTSKGFVTYRAYNFSVEKTSLTTSTRAPNFDVNTTTSVRNVARRIRGRDPLAQTFFVKKGMGQGSNSVYLSDVDIYFKRKPSQTVAGSNANAALNGVSVQIREVVNGYPTNQILPFANVHKLPASVFTSEDASVATKFTFDAPVRLDIEKEYAIVIQPDASDPNYLVYTSKVGGTDLTPGDTQGSAIVQDWGDGVLFTSTNNSAWKSYQDEDIKFTVNRHNFNSSAGTVKLTNNKNEFFTVNNITGRFTAGETIYQAKGTSATVGLTNNSKTVTGTALSSVYNEGDFMMIEGGNPVVKGLYKVVTIVNADTLTLDRPWPITTGSANATPVVTGDLCFYDLRNPFEMHLENSSVSSARVFTLSDPADNTTAIYGIDSGSSADIASIDNINLSYIQPMIMQASDDVSKTTLSGEFVSPSNVNTSYTMPMKFNDNNYFSKNGVVIYSMSNDPSRTKVFNINVGLENGSNVTSTPFVDIEASKLIAYQHKITNSADTTAKYISKTIELSEDLDAEDFNLILTAYRPTGTDIKVYIKAQNAYDNDEFDNLGWTELELFEGVGTYSTITNLQDYRELKFRINKTNKTGGLAANPFTYTSQGGVFEGFKRFQIRIDLLSPNIHNAPTLKDYRGIALT